MAMFIGAHKHGYRDEDQEMTLLSARREDDQSSQVASITGIHGPTTKSSDVSSKETRNFEIILKTIVGSHRRHENRFKGAIFSLWLFAGLVGIILGINFAILIWTLLTPKRLGLSTAYIGPCARAQTINSLLHVFINALSSLMLAGSNFTTQYLSSPTRDDVDRMHSRGKDLDIGIPSLRNLPHLGRTRIILWSMLALTSLPLHLVYNPVVFLSNDPFSWKIIAAGTNFVDAGNHDLGQIANLEQDFWKSYHVSSAETALQNISFWHCLDVLEKHSTARTIMITEQNPTNSPLGVWWHLSSDEVGYNEWYNLHAFIGASFAEPVQLNISSSLSANGSSISWEGIQTSYASSNGSSTSSADIEVAYCLSAERPCSVRVSLTFQAIVVFCNACKLSAILVTALRARGGRDHLSSAGDALSSFLERPDSYTTGRCLLASSASPGDHGGPRTPAILRRRKRYTAISKNQVSVAVVLWALLYVTMGVGSYFWKQQDLVQSFSDPAGILRTLLIPNLPQLLLTFQYLVLNRCFTIMQMSMELNKFGALQQALRVTSPLRSVHGKQRSTYWLSLPIHFSIPLIILGALLHWLVSQASFAEFSISDGMGLGTLKFDKMYMFGTLIGGVVFACGTIWYGDLLLPSDMPVLGYSSLALAAACHPPEDDSDAALKEVKWGDVNSSDAEVGHCCFTSKEVTALQPDRLYA